MDTILEDNDSYEPLNDEVYDYAKFIGMDVQQDAELLWIAVVGLKTPVPEPWQAYVDPEDGLSLYYFNKVTGESTWEHPEDNRFRALYQAHKKRRDTCEFPSVDRRIPDSRCTIRRSAAESTPTDFSDCTILAERLQEARPAEDFRAYARWLGLDEEADKDLLHIAQSGLTARLPADWAPCRHNPTNRLFYFNFASGESSWEHPCDTHTRALVHGALGRAAATSSLTPSPPASQQAEGDSRSSATSIVLEEVLVDDFEPNKEELNGYAELLGMNLAEDAPLLWIARLGLREPLPADWKPCRVLTTGEMYFFNFRTGATSWDHPCDDQFRQLYRQERQKMRGEGATTTTTE